MRTRPGAPDRTRHLSPSTIVLDGVGLGAAIAAETAGRHPQAAGADPRRSPSRPRSTLQFDRAHRLLPIRLLFHDRFDPTKTLASLRTPKLMLYSTRGAGGLYYEEAAEPKQTTTVTDLFRDQKYLPCLRSFLGKYLPGG